MCSYSKLSFINKFSSHDVNHTFIYSVANERVEKIIAVERYSVKTLCYRHF